MLYFLGGGNMASAIINSLRNSGSKQEIFVCDGDADKRRQLETRYGIQTGASLPALTANDILLLAVKPQDMQSACADLDNNGALILSIAAGLAIDTLSRYLGGTRRIVRIMPNTPAQIGLGVSALFANADVSAADRQLAESIMACTGMTLWLESEEYMHAITGISGSGSAYVFYFMNALQQAAVTLGFDDKQSRELALATFKGAVALAEQSGADFLDLQNNVTSKGGTTFAALETFRSHHLADIIEKGVQAAVARSQSMQNG